ncbi:dehydrogenase [Clostridia bacterium]|nr:dehydrogenase [Clostridia bacterium]
MKRIGIVGCGAISGIYLENITNMFGNIEIAGVCDLIPERTEAVREKYGVKVYASADELVADPAVDIVLNITRPYEHFDVTIKAIKAGKHVYTEKSLAPEFSQGETIINLAKERSVTVCGAPDTFLGAGIQTCRKLIDEGAIGDIVGASAFMVCRGHESWHPDPEFYYQYGGGPMFDMGPYYTTALISLLGTVESVVGAAKTSFATRTITSEPKNGTIVNVTVPTHVAGILNFKNGATGTILTTFDVYTAEVPRIEIYGSKGTLSVPDPNTFGGPVRLYTPETKEFVEQPLAFPYPDNSRALGLSDMAKAIEEGRKPRASSELILHVLEVMEGFYVSEKTRAYVDMKTSAERPAPMENKTIG